MSAAIVIDKLSKRYPGSDVDALHDLSLSVQAGEIYGFLGPNGAGKSTTIRTLMNFIQPTAGRATILGLDVAADSVAIKRTVGYLASDMAMYGKLTGRQFLNYMAELQPGTDRHYRKQLMERLQAEPDKRLGDLSRGNRQKVAIVQAFMHRPTVLILDEPSSGLDPLMQETFYDILREARQHGAAVFMSSHILSEVQKICDRVGIIKDGQLLVERNIAEMAREAAHTFQISFTGKPPLAELRKLKALRVSEHGEHDLVVHARGELSPLFRILARHQVAKLEARQLDLEELFMSYYGGEKS